MSMDAYRKCSKCGASPAGNEFFHRFPKPGKSNVLRARAWAKYCWPEKDWLSVTDLTQLYQSNKVLCKKHFQDSCFTDSTKKRLRKFSVPGEKEYVSRLMATLRSEMSLFHTHEQLDEHTTMQYPKDSPSQSKEKIQHTSTSDILPTPGTSSLAQPVQSDLNIAPVQSISDILRPQTIDTKNIKKRNKGILKKTLDVTKVSQLTTREEKLYRICTQSVKELNRLRKNLKKIKKKNRIQNIVENENVQKLLNLNISNSFIVLLQSQMKNCPKRPKGQRYNLEQKIMALTIYKKSPACYRLLRRMFALPCQSTLNKLLNRIPLKAGINAQIFKGLKDMVAKQTDNDNVCILSFDEMAIRKHLHYNERLDLIEGFQDHGHHGRTNQIACNALVFMLAGIRKKWKQPIAFYFSGKSVTSDRLFVIIKEVLHECFKTGLNVVGTICDMSTVNMKALEVLGSSTEKPYFSYEEREIVTILDPPHLLKCTRNNFMKYNVKCITNFQSDGKIITGVAEWKHIKAFYDLDKNNPNFVFAPALSESHITPNTKQKMRVKLAAQVFSHSVAAGILAKIASSELPSEAHATATFLNKFDQLFDSLNADTPDLRGGKKFSMNITVRSPHLILFAEMKKFINTMKFVGSKSAPPSQSGWIRTMNAVERLWRNLQSAHVQSLSTRRLNQDPLENCFGCIRYHCGSNDNPTVSQFISGIKTAIISNLRHCGSKKNCEDDMAVLADNLKSFLLCHFESPIDEPNEVLHDIDSFITDATEAVEQASPEAQACAYVCGFIYKRYINHTCPACKNVFLTAQIEPFHIFTSFKEFESLSNSLKYVNIRFVQCVEIMSTTINTLLENEGFINNIEKYMLSNLAQVNFDFLDGCKDHYEINKNKICSSCFHICIKRYTIKKNREFTEEETAKSLKKKINILKNK